MSTIPAINPGVITAKMSWDSLTAHECAAAYLAASWGTPYTIPKENLAYQAAKDRGLIDERGVMHEITFQGLILSVNDRAQREI